MNNIDYLDTQDNFNQTMCQAQAVIMALSGDDQIRYMNADHVAGLLLLTLQQLEQLNTSYKNILAAVKTEVFNGTY